MGRDVSYSPFTWQNQSSAHNRFLKFLCVIILLSLLSFYIGYPDTKLDTPQTGSLQYRVPEVPHVSYSEPDTKHEEPPTERIQEVTSTEFSSTSLFDPNSAFNESVIPSGPDPMERNISAEKLKVLEEEERKIIESQEDIGKEEAVVSDIGIGGNPENALVRVTEETSTETPNEENKEKDVVEEETTSSSSEAFTATTQKNEETQQENGSDTTEEVVPKQIGIEEAEKQIAQVSDNLTQVEETAMTTQSDENHVESTTISFEQEGNHGIVLENASNTTETAQEAWNKPEETLPECHVEEWNNVTLDEVPHQSVFKQWLSQNYKPDNNETENFPNVLGVFAYKTHIAVTLSAKNYSTETVLCHYYDCNKKQMVHQMKSFVFPEATVYCPRRSGAKYISISEGLEEQQLYPVQSTKRLVPHHFFTVCVAINNHEENILRIARFIEYYKLQGSTFFHVYLKNSSHYQRMLLDDYVRTGDIKVIKIGDNVTEEVQANDCQHRSKYFSKWTAFLKVDDQLEMKEESETISSFLDSIVEHKTNILKWSSLEDGNSTRLLIRPERIVSINHHPIMVYLGNQLSESDEPSGILKQLSSSSDLSPLNFSDSVSESVPFRDELIENVISRTKHVHTTIEVDNQKHEDAHHTFEQSIETSNNE